MCWFCFIIFYQREKAKKTKKLAFLFLFVGTYMMFQRAALLLDVPNTGAEPPHAGPDELLWSVSVRPPATPVTLWLLLLLLLLSQETGAWPLRLAVENLPPPADRAVRLFG